MGLRNPWVPRMRSPGGDSGLEAGDDLLSVRMVALLVSGMGQGNCGASETNGLE